MAKNSKGGGTEPLQYFTEQHVSPYIKVHAHREDSHIKGTWVLSEILKRTPKGYQDPVM